MRIESFLWIVAGIGSAWVLTLLVVFVIAVWEAHAADKVLRESRERFEEYCHESSERFKRLLEDGRGHE